MEKQKNVVNIPRDMSSRRTNFRSKIQKWTAAQYVGIRPIYTVSL